MSLRWRVYFSGSWTARCAGLARSRFKVGGDAIALVSEQDLQDAMVR